MVLDPDLEKLAKESRHKLVQEFAEKYANLDERTRRAPIGEAELIAQKFSCSLQIAIVAYLINLEGILGVGEAVTLLTTELQRRAEVGEDIPNIPGNIMEFAIAEGRWIEHIYTSFVRQLELKTRELANLEQALEDENPSVEKALPVLHARTKLAEAYIIPVVETWLNEHLKANSEDVLIAFGPALTKWKESTIRGKLIRIRRRNQAIFRHLKTIMDGAPDSATMDATIKRIDTLVAELDAPLDNMSIKAVAHLLLHIAPRLSGRGDRTRYVDHGMASTRGNKTEPDMASPFDFLERDVRLAKRRTGDEREEYLREKISRVIRVLMYQGLSILDCVEQCINEIVERLHLQEIQIEDVLEESRTKLAETSESEREDFTVELVFGFVNKHVYGD
ncbi:MAG: hypothetical protein RTU30_09475 [Candidatus Thorarchaeota archaeon]